MNRVVIFGPGAAGKSTLALRLGEITGIPVIELDKVFWRPGLLPTPRDEWVALQQTLVHGEQWILDGDLGPYDAVEPRLHVADTVIFLDFSVIRCVWRAICRSRERADFFHWLLTYRRKSRPTLLNAIAEYAPTARLHILRNPKAVLRFLEEIARCRLGP
jgi:adenylate kinase family enzyme